MEKLIEYIPVVSSGTFYCEHEDCGVVQNDDSLEDVLYYGNDDGMYCKEHVKLHPIIPNI